MESRQLALFLLSICSIVLFVVASCLPGWIILTIDIINGHGVTKTLEGNNSSTEVSSKSRVTIQISLWYAQSCISGHCEIQPWSEIANIPGMNVVDSIDVTEYKIEGVFALGLGIGAMAVIFANAKIRILSLKSEATVAILFASYTAVKIIILARISGAHTDTEKDIQSSSAISLQYAYCPILVGISVCLTSIGVILAVIGACKEKKEQLPAFTDIEPLPGSDSEIETSQSTLTNFGVHNQRELDAIPEEPTVQFSESADVSCHL